MLTFFLFLAFMCFLISYLVYGVYLSTIYKNEAPYMENDQPREYKKLMLGGFIFCISFSIIFLFSITLISSRVGMEDFWLALLLFVLISYITSLLTARYQKSKQKQNNFKRINRNSLILLVILFIFFGVTDDSIETSSSESTAGENVENTEEVSSNEEDKKDDLADKEKEEAEALAAKEKAERDEKAKEEQLAKEKAAKEKAEKEKAEQERQERLAAEKKAKEEKEKERLEKEKAEKEAAEKAEEQKDGLIPVSLYRVVDGDTVNVLNEDNEELKLRLLLIDTPETVHPNKPVEPFGQEASDRLTTLLNSGEQLYIEYDDGAKTDHYDRHLVYLYVGDTSVHEVLLEEGLARVGYIYEQQRYLDEFRAKEAIAKEQQIGIWSLPGYVNEGGEGFNSENETEVSETTDDNSTPTYINDQTNNNNVTSAPAETGSVEFFNNCKELNAVYPGGVSSDHAAYQSKMDRDKDNWACEK